VSPPQRGSFASATQNPSVAVDQQERFGELLWSYHWFQMALYEALMTTPVDD